MNKEARVYMPTPEAKEAIGILTDEMNNWKDGTIDITDDISYQMREEIKKARKNYYGRFENEKDETTGLDKIFVPLTEWSVESMIKNVDLDTKDITIKAPTSEKIGIAGVLRLIVQNFLKKTVFGEILNDIQRRMVIDGTCVVKCTKSFSREHKKTMPDVRVVDLLNFYIDPAARSIQEATAVIEKNVMTIDELSQYEGKWDNLKYVQPTNDARFEDMVAAGFSDSEVPLVEIYERWGKIDKSWATGKEEDKDKWVDGVVVASGIESDSPIIHKISINKKKLKPYEECWMRRTPARWGGRGIPEMLRGLQLYVNSIVNIRRNNALLLQNGIFKVRKGAGITQQTLSSLKAGGAVPVDNMDDIEELRTGDIKSSSYQDEQAIYMLADKVTGTKELPSDASMAPTTAVIQQKDVRSAASMIQENLEFFLKRLFKRHLIPLIVESLEDREVMRITGAPEDIQEIDNAIIDYFTNDAILKHYKTNGAYPTQGEIDMEKERARKKFQRMGTDRFLEIWKDQFDENFDIDISVTTEEFDKEVIMRQLNDLLFAYTKTPGSNLDVNGIMRQMLDIMGLQGSSLMVKNPVPVMGGQELPNPQGGMTTAFSQQQATMPMGGTGAK